MFEVLIYLFEKYIHTVEEKSDGEQEVYTQQEIAQELTTAGFHPKEIVKALTWLEDLDKYKSVVKAFDSPNHESMRVLTESESHKLGQFCQSFLLFLEQMHILNADTREMVIDRAMAVDNPKISLEQLKWIVMLVLFHQAEKDQELDWLENLILAECHLDVLH